MQDVAEKLALPSADDAEYICAKAIRDGGIDAVLDHAGGFLATRELTDLYSTNEPQVGRKAGSGWPTSALGIMYGRQ